MLANGWGGLRFLVAADLFISLHFLETWLLLRLASQSFTAGVFQIAFHGTPLVAQEKEEEKKISLSSSLLQSLFQSLNHTFSQV